MQDFLLLIISTINTYMSNYILLFLLISVGLWYSFKTKFVQIRCFGEAIRRIIDGLSFQGEKQKIGVTSFQAFLNALAVQIGTGNIVGASGAILMGGPGAIFWMWIIAFFGMATSYAETVCALKTRQIGLDGTIKGGPAYYITAAFKGKLGKFLSSFFAVCAMMAMGFTINMVQSNSIGFTLNNAFGVPNWITGIILVSICWFIFRGGLVNLASVTEKLVPIMSYIFIGGAIAVIIARIQYLPETLYMIFYYAFQPQAIIGGTFGEALKIAVTQGVKRGLSSNEAGMGSTPHAHVQANVENPHEQGIVAMIGVFFDTFVVLTLNALVIISTLYTSDGVLFNGYKGEVTEIINQANLAQVAFASVLDAGLHEGFGSQFIAICLFFFAFSTILVSYSFGKINVVYLFGEKIINVYIVIALAFIFIGTLASSDFVWEMTDLFFNLMGIPNAIALFALTNVVVDSCAGLKKVYLIKKNTNNDN